MREIIADLTGEVVVEVEEGGEDEAVEEEEEAVVEEGGEVLVEENLMPIRNQWVQLKDLGRFLIHQLVPRGTVYMKDLKKEWYGMVERVVDRKEMTKMPIMEGRMILQVMIERKDQGTGKIIQDLILMVREV